MAWLIALAALTLLLMAACAGSSERDASPPRAPPPPADVPAPADTPPATGKPARPGEVTPQPAAEAPPAADGAPPQTNEEPSPADGEPPRTGEVQQAEAGEVPRTEEAPPAPEPVATVEPLRLLELARLGFPLDLATRPGDENLYVAQKGGVVSVASPEGWVADTHFLNLSNRMTTESERGLIGITFSPSGDRFYAHYSGARGENRLASWAVTEGRIDPESEVQHLAIEQPFANHNGGQIAFGPDGFLYMAIGDGGSAGDPGDNGQNPSTLLGAILRINPTPEGLAGYTVPEDNPFARGGGAPEVWAFGLRNPWRFSFDRATGDIWIGDVGQDKIEEVDFLAAGTGAGANFGWNRLEGTRAFSDKPPAGAVPPVFEYGRKRGYSITGGYVYRGSAIPSLVGQYVFGDFGSGFVASLGFDPGGQPIVQELSVTVPGLTSFGQDQHGELYVLSAGGLLAKLVPAT